MGIEQKVQLEDAILKLFKQEPSLTTMKIVDYIKQSYPNVYDSYIRQRVWGLIDRGLIELALDRKLRMSEPQKYE
ncbi:MAG: hypothetical protein AABW48_05510 [Nanoarchaeota archaeon]